MSIQTAKDEAYRLKLLAAKDCQGHLISFIGDDLLKYTIVCPAAGGGDMTRGMDLKIYTIFLFDLHLCPTNKTVVQCCYKVLDVNSLGDRILIFENPPFGQYHGVLFFNTMAAHSNVEIIANVFPHRFVGLQKSAKGTTCLNEYFHLVSYVLLPADSFETELTSGATAGIQCSFQIWKRMLVKRPTTTVCVRVGKHYVRRDHTILNLKHTLSPHAKRNKGTSKRSVLTRSVPNCASMPISIDPTKDTPLIRAVILKAFANSWRHKHTPYNYHPGILQIELDKLLK
jgi:hypothetical protein